MGRVEFPVFGSGSSKATHKFTITSVTENHPGTVAISQVDISIRGKARIGGTILCELVA